MSKSRFRQIVEKISPAQRRFVRKQGDIAMQLGKLLEERGWTQRRLAEETGKKESYISRILSGGGNPTIKTIAELEEAVGAEILVAPMFREQHTILQVSIAASGPVQSRRSERFRDYAWGTTPASYSGATTSLHEINQGS